MAEASTPVEIFCSYAHADERWLRRLETHLSLLKRQGLISLWYDRLIVPGVDWANTIDTHLETASVILLLVSANFLASDYCYGIEMKRALERQKAGEAQVIPVLVRSADWTGAPFSHLQALPTNGKPLATQQNKETALTNVAAGIRRAIEELPLLTASAPRAALPAIWNIPYPRNPFFLGRDAELAHLRSHLQAGQATAFSQPQAISGLGGIGKTQLALEYAYRYHQDYQAVLWAPAESTEALVSSYLVLATLLRLPERETREQEIIMQAVKTWLQTHRDWLLILDNADELRLLPDFLPSSLGGHLLLTTRAAVTGRLARRLEIETLLPEHGALFLLRRAALLAPDAELSQAPPQERELAVQISQELGGLPLALDQAGAYLEETGMGLVGYWHIYQQDRAAIFHKRGGLVSDHPEPVATTWSLSFQRVEEKNPAAADLLRLCAYLAPDSIAEEILTEGAPFLGPILQPIAEDPSLLNQAIEALRGYSLVQRDPRNNVLSIHRLVQAVLQEDLDEAERSRWSERAVLAVNAAFPASGYEMWLQCGRLLPHALVAAQWSKIYQINRTEVGRLLHETAVYLWDRVHYQKPESLYKQTFCIQEYQLDVESLYQRALHIWEQQLGSKHPDLAALLNNLAICYAEQRKYAEAEACYRRALHIWEDQLGPGCIEVATVLSGLATLHVDQGKYPEAKPLYQRALRIREQHQHPSTNATRKRLIALLYAMEQHEEAAQLEATRPEP